MNDLILLQLFQFIENSGRKRFLSKLHTLADMRCYMFIIQVIYCSISVKSHLQKYQIVIKLLKSFKISDVFLEFSCFAVFAGLPPSPPSLPTATATIDDQPSPGLHSDGSGIKPIGVDVPRRKKNGIGKNAVIVIVLSSITIFVVCAGFLWLLFLKCGCCTHLPRQNPHVLIAPHGKPSGMHVNMNA